MATEFDQAETKRYNELQKAKKQHHENQIKKSNNELIYRKHKYTKLDFRLHKSSLHSMIHEDLYVKQENDIYTYALISVFDNKIYIEVVAETTKPIKKGDKYGKTGSFC